MENKDLCAYPNPTKLDTYGGLTKLEAFTLAAMQGIMANPNTNFRDLVARDEAIPNIVEDAVLVAKATLRELEKPS